MINHTILTNSVSQLLKQSIHTADGLYHRLVLVVGKTSSGKTTLIREIAAQFATNVFNVSLAISGALLDLTPKQRSLRLPALLQEIVPEGETPLFLDNLEILFDSNLQQDPLRLLQSISRNRAVVASWNGIMNSGRLLYAETGHPEYRSYDSVDALIVGMDGKATVDSAKNNREAGQA